MRVLVTGGSGFIGSHVVDKLRDQGHEPVIYDLRPSPWHAEGSVETVLGSITDREAIRTALTERRIDAITHLAAVADVNDVHAEPGNAEEINARGTAAVLEAARVAEVQRVVYASTIWVYSDTDSETVSETTLLPPPAHLYTATKLAGELYCKSYQELYGVNYTILRFGIPYGPRAREAAVIPAFVNKAFAGEPLTLSGDGLQSRRFVYVEDLAEGVVAGLGDIAENRVYNLASDENVTIKRIAEVVQEIVGNTEILYGPARPGDLGSKIVLADRARDELGWSAHTPFLEGVRRYVDWRHQQAALKAANPEPEGSLPLALAGESETQVCPRKVLIVSADIGEGHDLPARAVAQEFKDEEPDALVSIVNGLPAMGPFMTKVLRENSAFMFKWLPWLFDFQYRLFMEFPPTRWVAGRMLGLFGRRGILRLVKAHDPDVIISTYPGTTQLLGELRRTGRIDAPVYSSITDLAGLRFWAHPGVDMHFITHPESVEEVEEVAGPGSVRWAKPPTNRDFLQPRDRSAARKVLGLTDAGTVIAVSGGGWGVGDIGGAVRTSLDVEDATVLCLCGHNDDLRARMTAEFGDNERVVVMGFTNHMGDVLAAANLLIHSSAGLTVLEALIRGCPVVSYGFGYGHIRVSNEALERFGLAQVARSEEQLAPAVKRALEMHPEPDASFASRATTASLILNNERRVTPLPTWRVRTVRTLTASAATLVVALWVATASLAYSLIADVAGANPLTGVNTAQKQVGLMIDVSPNETVSEVSQLASMTCAQGMKVTFALQNDPRHAAHWFDYCHDDAVPRLSDSGLVGWLGTSGRLRRLAHEFHWGRHYPYATSGASFAQWWEAHHAGGQPVAGAVKISQTTIPAKLHAGEMIELRPKSLHEAQIEIQELGEQLTDQHLHSVTVRTLLKDSGTHV
jgi:UDP-glucose 4-epimerase